MPTKSLMFSFRLQAKLHLEVLNDHDEKHQAEMEIFRRQLLEAFEEKERDFATRKTMEIEFKKQVTELLEKVTELENILYSKKQEYKTKVNKFKSIIYK